MPSPRRVADVESTEEEVEHEEAEEDEEEEEEEEEDEEEEEVEEKRADRHLPSPDEKGYTSTGTDVDGEKHEQGAEEAAPAEPVPPTRTRSRSRGTSTSQSRFPSEPPLQRLASHLSFRRRRSQPGEAAYQVHFVENDPANPRSWSPRYKTWITMQLGFIALVGSIGSSIISPAEPVIAEYTGVSQEITVFVVALYVLGFAFGPMAWAPISEVYGRRWSILPAIAVLGLFSIGTATSKNAASIFITRFFGGVFGSAPIANVSAALGDMYEPKARGIAITFYAVMVVGGPTLGPIVGAALTNNASLGWRWTEYLLAIYAGFMVILAFFCLPELYSPVILKRKAVQLRNDTGDQRYWHPHEAERMTWSNIFTKYFSRPVRMLVTEPMVACIACYASYVYGILYMTLEVFPIVFREKRGYGAVVSTLPFLGVYSLLRCLFPSDGLLTDHQVSLLACCAQWASIWPINLTTAKLSPRTMAVLHRKLDCRPCSSVDASSPSVCFGSDGRQIPNITGAYRPLPRVSLARASTPSSSSVSITWSTHTAYTLHPRYPPIRS